MFPFIQCQCFDKRRGAYLLGKVSVFIKIRVLFWSEISALGVFLNFDNERMRPLNTKVPPGTSPHIILLDKAVRFEFEDQSFDRRAIASIKNHMHCKHIEMSL